jgi:hypothetical protein
MDPKIELPLDAEPVARPKEVTRAVQLLSASFAIGGIRSVFDLVQKIPGVYLLLALLGLAVFLGMFFFLVSKIAAGRNWARIISLILFLIGLPLAIPGYLVELRTTLAHGLVSIVIAVLQLIGIWLLFTKNSNLWFKTRK